MSQQITVKHERIDDSPVIIAQRKKRRVDTLRDQHFPTNGHGTGWRLGDVVIVWLTVSLSEGDHRLSRVEPWVAEPTRTRRRCVGTQVEPRDGTEDRLATTRADVSVTENGVQCEWALHQSVRRVSDVPKRLGRVDRPTVSAFVTPAGRFQLGHSKDHRPDVPQVQLAMSGRDPLGWPWTTTGVAGNTADDPRSLPAIATVRTMVERTGLRSVGACTRAALGPRAAIGAHGDFSLCPLSATQRPEAARNLGLEPVLTDAQPLAAVRLAYADEPADEPAAPVAVGWAYTVEPSGQEQSGQRQRWHERRRVVRALACAARQAQSLRRRGARAVPAINALDERQQGTKRWPDEAAARAAAEALIAQ